MRGKSISLAVISCSMLLWGCAESTVGPLPPRLPEVRGFSYTSFSQTGFTEGGQHDALGDMKTQINNNWVALCILEYQSNPYSADIAPNETGRNPLTGDPWSTTSAENDIREGASQARAHHMSILLKPQVDLYTGEWRAAIHPDNGGAWFSSYGSMIVKYARLAEELHAEMLCIGTEYVFATQHSYTPQWRALITSVRGVYTGKLVYAANWSGAYQYGISRPEFAQVEFWDNLDAIGIDAYYPLTNSSGDTIPPYDAALFRVMDEAAPIGLLSSLHNRPVIITEVGIQSVSGALAAPWDYSLGNAPGAVQDNRVQDFYYRVIIDALGKQQWCQGMFWWHWESSPSPNESTNYTPRNKPAAERLHEWYIGPPM